MKAFWEIQEINNLTERRCSRLKQSGSGIQLFFSHLSTKSVPEMMNNV